MAYKEHPFKCSKAELAKRNPGHLWGKAGHKAAREVLRVRCEMTRPLPQGRAHGGRSGQNGPLPPHGDGSDTFV